MLKVGLTGGIGVGKTTVSDCFQDLGVPVIDTDVIARELVHEGSNALQAIVTEFGAEVLTDSGALDRQRLGQIVFSDPAKRRKLEAILHPEIRRVAFERMQGLDADYCIVVVPLLVETGFNELVDRVLVVDAPDDKRIGWLERRRGLSEAAIADVISAQASREDRLKIADYVIRNNGTVSELRDEVRKLHRRILSSIEQGASA